MKTTVTNVTEGIVITAVLILIICYGILSLKIVSLSILTWMILSRIIERHVETDKMDKLHIQAGIFLGLIWITAVIIDSKLCGSGIFSMDLMKLTQIGVSISWILYCIRKPLGQLKFSIVIMTWCKGIGDLFIDSNPDPEIEKIEFQRWNENNGERDIIGVTLGISLKKKEECS